MFRPIALSVLHKRSSQYITVFATLFAEDPLLMLADKNLDVGLLEKKINEQIQHVDYWLRKNKLSLNYLKTNYLLIVINKYPPKKMNENFFICINDNFLDGSFTVKYLVVFIDDTLNWSSHIQYSSCLVSLLVSLAYSTDCAIMLKKKLFACFIIALYTVECNIALLCGGQLSKLI